MHLAISNLDAADREILVQFYYLDTPWEEIAELSGLVPKDGVLIDPARPGFINSYFVRGLVFFIFVFGLLPAVVYGLITGSIRSDTDVYKGMQKTMELAAPYLVVVFFIAQFVNYFAWSNLGAILSISGANALKSAGLQGVPLLVSMVLLCASINLFITSASAKWAFMAPVFVPMFVLLGFTPEGTQAIFRVGDSATNIVTPLFPYLPFILATARKYEPKAGAGTLVSMMLPYSGAFLVFWTLLLVLFDVLRWPIGPGVFMRLPG